MMFLCMDANFRLKNQLVSNYSQDPGLGMGWAYMAPREEYESYVLSRASDGDVRIFFFPAHRMPNHLDFDLDQYLRWTSSLGQNEHQVFQRSLLYGCGRCYVWSIGDDHAAGYWEFAEG